jgi:hypothetical protein
MFGQKEFSAHFRGPKDKHRAPNSVRSGIDHIINYSDPIVLLQTFCAEPMKKSGGSIDKNELYTPEH